MTILTPAQLAIQRTQPQATNLFLSVYKPTTTLSARVTGTYTFGAMSISYTPVTGSYLNVFPDSVLLLGTSPDDDDIGRIRVRSITNSTVSIAENDFTLISGTYMTFLNYVDIVAVYPRIIQDPNNVENVIFYKDYDIPYSNQNSIYGTFPCAGPHRATFASATGTVYYSATGTYNVLGNPVTYQWEFEGGTPTGSTSFVPGYVAYNTPGHYKTKLTVYASGTVGNTIDTTYRFVSVYDRPELGDNPPTLKWELMDFSGDRSGGGYSVGFRVFENLGDIEPNALVVLFADDVYGVDTVSLGGNATNSSEIVFVGYILGDTIKFNYKESYVEFRCGSVTDVMKQAEGFSVSCESKAAPATWFELKEMSIQKALYHYLRWHSTVLSTTDYQYTGDDRLVQYFDADRGSLYDAVNSFIDTGVLGETVADRQGKIWAEITPPGYENPFAELPFNFTLQKQDWMEEPSITERRTSDVSVIEMGGIEFEGVSTNGFNAYLSTAPSLTPYYRGKVESPKEGLILNSQTQLNQIAGNFVATRNADYEDVTVNLVGNYRNLDIAPIERFGFDINNQDTLTDSLLGWSFYPTSMNWQYNPTKGSFYPQASFQPIVTGTAGQTLLIPATPPEVGYSYPSLNLPPIPYFPPYGGGNIVQQVGRTVLMADRNLGFVYTKDFDSTNPTWIAWNTGLDGEYITSQSRQFFITPNGAVWCLLVGVSSKTYIYDRLYRAPFVGGEFKLIVDKAWLEGQYPGYPTYEISSITYNPTKPEEIGVVMGGLNAGTLSSSINLWVINYPSMVKGTYGITTDIRHGSLSFDPTAKEWTLIEDYLGAIPAIDYTLWILNYAGTALIFRSAINAWGSSDTPYILRGTNSSKMYAYNVSSSNYWITSDDNGRNVSAIGDNQEVGATRWSYACSPSGQFILGNWTLAALKGSSGDYGYTWTGLGALPPGGAYCFAYAGGGNGESSGWIAANGIVRYSPNYGNTWINKEGNLLLIAPIPSIYGIFALVETRDI